MWKSREDTYAKLQKKLGAGVEIFTFANTPYALLTGGAEKGVNITAVAEATQEQVAATKADAQKAKQTNTKKSNSGQQQHYRYRRKKK